MNHYFIILFFFFFSQKKTPLLIHKQGLGRRVVAEAPCFPANITYLLQWSLSSLERSAHKYPPNCIESSRKFTFQHTPKKTPKIVRFYSYCKHLTGTLCIPIWKHGILTTAAPLLSASIAYLLGQVKISVIRAQIRNILAHIMFYSVRRSSTNYFMLISKKKAANKYMEFFWLLAKVTYQICQLHNR